jgi:hypothetical protein
MKKGRQAGWIGTRQCVRALRLRGLSLSSDVNRGAGSGLPLHLPNPSRAPAAKMQGGPEIFSGCQKGSHARSTAVR